MDQSKKIIILGGLMVIFVSLVIFLNVKYKESANNKKYVEPTNNIVEKKKPQQQEENKDNENTELINSLYRMIAVKNPKTECLDFYTNSKTITKDNLSPELLSYLVLKNMDLTSSKDNTFKSEDVDKVLIKLFNTDQIINNTYTANIDNTNYKLDYNLTVNLFYLEKKAAEVKEYTLESDIIDSEVNDDEVTITESYKLTLNNELNEGKIKYTFKKGDNNYYFYSSEKVS